MKLRMCKVRNDAICADYVNRLLLKKARKKD